LADKQRGEYTADEVYQATENYDEFKTRLFEVDVEDKRARYQSDVSEHHEQGILELGKSNHVELEVVDVVRVRWDDEAHSDEEQH
jgi:hypothetical protein